MPFCTSAISLRMFSVGPRDPGRDPGSPPGHPPSPESPPGLCGGFVWRRHESAGTPHLAISIDESSLPCAPCYELRSSAHTLLVSFKRALAYA